MHLPASQASIALPTIDHQQKNVESVRIATQFLRSESPSTLEINDYIATLKIELTYQAHFETKD